jgi:hypothetical protein
MPTLTFPSHEVQKQKQILKFFLIAFNILLDSLKATLKTKLILSTVS